MLSKVITTVNGMHRAAYRLLCTLLLIINAAALGLLVAVLTADTGTAAELYYYLPDTVRIFLLSFTLALGGCFLYDYERRRGKTAPDDR